MSEGNGNQENSSPRIPEGFNIGQIKPGHPSRRRPPVPATISTGEILPFRPKKA